MKPRCGCLLVGLALLAVAVLLVVAAVWLFSAPPTAPGPRAAGEAARAVPSTGAAGPSDDATAGRPVPTSGGRLRIAGADPTTLDPALVRDVVSAEYMYEIYSGLVSLSPDLEVIPDVATGWEVDSSGTVYTFSLQLDAVFHDGEPVRAADVVYALERACDPATDPTTGSLVAETYLGDIVGCRDKLAGRARTVTGLSAADERHVVITIDAPKAYFLSKLTYPAGFVLDRRQVEGDSEWTRRPNGTGPFRLASYEPEQALVLERNDVYYGVPALLEAVEYDLRPVAAVTLYENGELDAVPVGLADLARVSDPLNPLSREVVQGPGDLGLSYLGFNIRQPPFDDVQVRRAFNLALDKQRLTAVVLGGAVVPADWILPPGMPGHTADISPYRFDPQAARDALAASRYGGPGGLPPLTLNSAGSGGGDTAAEAVADLIGEVLGLQIAVEQAPWDVFQNEQAAGVYGLYLLGWSADYPDPQDFLDVLFHSQSPLNHTGFADPEVDRLLEAARTERDEARRLELYRQAERQILDAAPWLPLYTGVDSWLVAPNVHGFIPPPIVLPRMGRVWLSGD